MIFLNCGNKWDIPFLEKIIQYNRKHTDICIAELYGDVNLGVFRLGVRSNDRIPAIGDWSVIEKYVKKANAHNIEINYTLNKSCLGDIFLTEKSLPTIQNIIKKLENMGVSMFTVYSPYLLKNLKFKHSEVEVSTIHNQTNVNYIRSLITLNPSISKICLPIYMNRDFVKLKKLVRGHREIIFELIVNEFCVGSSNTCVYRAECYNIQSHNQTFHYPFDVCTAYRKKSPVAWIKAPFILPEWLEYYEDIGINSFKLTGRTHPSKIILKTVGWYMKQKSPLYLHQLWGMGLPGQALYEGKYIRTTPLKSRDFLTLFANRIKNNCENLLCGIECRYCYEMARRCYEKKFKASSR